MKKIILYIVSAVMLLTAFACGSSEIKCTNCGKVIEAKNVHVDGSDKLCDDCSELVKCEGCGKRFESGQLMDKDGKQLCADCAQKEKCADCGKMFAQSEMTEYEGELYCSDDVRKCPSCKRVLPKKMFKKKMGEYICEECLSDE